MVTFWVSLGFKETFLPQQRTLEESLFWSLSILMAVGAGAKERTLILQSTSACVHPLFHIRCLRISTLYNHALSSTQCLSRAIPSLPCLLLTYICNMFEPNYTWLFSKHSMDFSTSLPLLILSTWNLYPAPTFSPSLPKNIVYSPCHWHRALYQGHLVCPPAKPPEKNYL